MKNVIGVSELKEVLTDFKTWEDENYDKYSKYDIEHRVNGYI